jgi:hypothetical protein
MRFARFATHRVELSYWIVPLPALIVWWVRLPLAS